MAQNDSLFVIEDDIVISGNRINLPFSETSRTIDVIDAEEIAKLQAGSINEILQLIPGVDIRQRGVNGVQGDLIIRGATFEQSLVLVNGIKLLDPQTGHHLMNIPVPLQDIERIEVLKGPAARIYGVNGFAGAINIITKPKSEFGLNYLLEFGDNDLFNGHLNVSIPLGNYKQSFGLNLQNSDGYRENTDYDIATLMYQSQLDLRNGRFKFMTGYTDRKFGANGFYGREDFTEQYEEVNTAFTAISYETEYKNWTISPRASWRRNEDNWQFLRDDPEFFQNFHTSQVFDFEVNASTQHKLGSFGVGMELIDFQLESSNLSDHERQQIGFHFENRFEFDKWDVTPGVFVMNISDLDSKVLPGIDIGYRLNSSLRFHANAGLTTRVPTYSDLYYSDSGNVGNPLLQEESAFSTELGLKYFKNNFSIQMALFNRSVTDQIDWFRETEADKWMPDNFADGRFTGVELSSFIELVDNYHYKSTLDVSYTYIDASFEDSGFAFSRNRLENLQHQANIRWQLDYDNIGFSIVAKHYNRVSIEDYTLVDFNFNLDLFGQQLFFKARNLFDTEYRETNLVPMPGRWLSFGMRSDLY